MKYEEFRKLPVSERAKVPADVVLSFSLNTLSGWEDLLALEGWERVRCDVDGSDVSFVWRRCVGGREEWWEVSHFDLPVDGVPPERCWLGSPSPCDPALIEH